jgi:hypothetical protein
MSNASHQIANLSPGESARRFGNLRRKEFSQLLDNAEVGQ